MDPPHQRTGRCDLAPHALTEDAEGSPFTADARDGSRRDRFGLPVLWYASDCRDSVVLPRLWCYQVLSYSNRLTNVCLSVIPSDWQSGWF